MQVMGVTYGCMQCGGEFESGWSDEDAQAEAVAIWPPGVLTATAVVCDTCYGELMAWRERRLALLRYTRDHGGWMSPAAQAELRDLEGRQHDG